MSIKRLLYLSILLLVSGCFAPEDEAPEMTVPTLTTKAAANITRTSATLGGSISGKWIDAIVEYGFVVGDDAALSSSRTYPIYSGMSSFSLELSSLEPNTTVFYAVYASSNYSTIKGSTLSFTTLSSSAADLGPVSYKLTGDSYTFNSSIVDLQGCTIKKVGFCLSESPDPSINSLLVPGEYVEGSTSEFTGTISSDRYDPGKKYYVKAYAECVLSGGSSTVYGYSEEESFTTVPTAPKVATVFDSLKVSSQYAYVGGNVIGNGGDEVTERGVVYSRNENPTINDKIVVAGSEGNAEFECKIEDLSISTRYYARAYAKNKVDVGYGEQISFTTLEGKAVVVTVEVIRTTGVSATVNGNVTDGGTSEVTERGMVWSTEHNPTISNYKKAAPTGGTGSFDVSISENVQQGYTYYVRAYAVNSSGTSYGGEDSFRLKEDAPRISLNDATNVTESSATVSATITDSFGMSVSDKGFVWSDSDKNPTIDGSGCKSESCSSGQDVFSMTITELKPGTKYYYRAYAENESGVGYSETKSFSTIAAKPRVTTSPVSSEDIEETKATLRGKIDDTGGESITERGFFYSTAKDPINTGNKKVVPGIGLEYSATITGLSEGTTYYFVAYAKNKVGIGYGYEVEFRAKHKRPAVSTGAVSGVGKNVARCSGEVTSSGGGTVKDKGIVWGTSSKPVIKSSSSASAGEGTGPIDLDMAGLAPGTVYYVRTYVITEDWELYGDEISFMTDSSGDTEDWNDNQYEW